MTERSVLAAVSGIDSNQTWIDSIGNNIANADTVGYKDSEVQFQDLLAEQLSGASGATATTGGVNPVAIGSGVQVAANEVNLQEGSLESTGNPSDVAIKGNGYLIVDNGGQQAYTRNGSLTVDNNGDLTTQEGGLVMGWQANAAGTVNNNAPVTTIKIPTGETIPATPTTDITLSGNLQAGSTTPQSIQVNTYDSLGHVVPITLTFTPSGTTDQWSVSATVPNPAGGAAENLFPTGASAPNATFSATGTIASISGVTANADGSFTMPVGTMPTGYSFPAGAAMDFTFPSPSAADAVTQFASAQSLTFNANGYPSGTMSSYSIGQDGTITGSFSNGATLALGQIALANFTNSSGLADQGGGLYSVSPNSGQALVGTPGTGGRGALLGGELEQSNVDLGSELTELITAQEAYTANTKTLTTSSNVMQALENVP